MKIFSKIIKKLKLEMIFSYIFQRKKMEIMEGVNEKKIFFFMIPTYGNIGDQAIAIATINFLKDYFSDYYIVTIDLFDTCKIMKFIETIIQKDDLVVIQGGGNMGNLYQYIEDYRRFIIKHLRNNKIISMPVTVTFTDDKNGKKQLRRSKKIYQKHNDFTIIAREKYSYSFVKKEFPKCKAVLNPDMVFYLYDETKINKFERRNLVVCLRRDIESIHNNINDIIKDIFSEYSDVKLFDTVVARDIEDEMRNLEVESVLNEFYGAKAVITDRMHGMILASITGTPCVVAKSMDNKIVGSYDWLKDLDYVELINDFTFDEVKRALDKVQGSMINKMHLKEDYFEKLSNIIK